VPLPVGLPRRALGRVRTANLSTLNRAPLPVGLQGLTWDGRESNSQAEAAGLRPAGLTTCPTVPGVGTRLGRRVRSGARSGRVPAKQQSAQIGAIGEHPLNVATATRPGNIFSNRCDPPAGRQLAARPADESQDPRTRVVTGSACCSSDRTWSPTRHGPPREAPFQQPHLRMSDWPMIRAAAESGDTVEDPSENALYMMLEDIEAGEGTYLIVGSLTDSTHQTYAQTSRNDDGTYIVEYRDGGPERHYGTIAQDMRTAHALITGWVFGIPGWRDSGHRCPLKRRLPSRVGDGERVGWAAWPMGWRLGRSGGRRRPRRSCLRRRRPRRCLGCAASR
jgi:hypothetical protein